MKLEDSGAIALAIVACIFDLHQRRIPNVLTFGAASAAAIAAFLTHGLPGLGASISGCLVGLAIWLPIYALGGMGAGDVKLLAAVGAWLGPSAVFHAALYAGVAGAVLALIVVLLKRCVVRTFSNIWLLLTHWHVVGFRREAGLTLETATSPRLAYAVPTLLGTVVAIWLS